MIATSKFQGHAAAVLCLDVSSPSLQSSSSSSPPPVSSPSSTSALLLSGSEDGTARLWDLRDHRRRACLCIRVPGGGDVLSAVFAPPAPEVEATTLTETEPKTTIRREIENDSIFALDSSVFLGIENTVLEYDLRHAASPIICSEPTMDWGKVLQNQDEVNQIGLVYYNKHTNNSNSNNGSTKKRRNQKKKGGSGNKKKQQFSDEDNRVSLYLAACDDAGKARWTEASWHSSRDSQNNNTSEEARCNNKIHANSTILHHDNHGVAVVPACAFRPNSHKRGGGGTGGASLELATGGTDCKIQLWNIFRPKKSISTFLTNQSNSEDDESKPQVCNPPFVYSLAWSNDGKSLSAGLGDGTVGVFEINNRTLVQRHLLVGSKGAEGTMHFAHESSVASVVYPSFTVPTSDRILCSAGSDGSIVFWTLGKPNDEEWDDIENSTNEGNQLYSTNDSDTNFDDAVAQLFPPRLLRGLYNTQNGDEKSIYSAPETASTSHKPRILFDIPHGKKINWVTPAAPSLGTESSSACNDTIFVADTSPDITSYTIPF